MHDPGDCSLVTKPRDTTSSPNMYYDHANHRQTPKSPTTAQTTQRVVPLAPTQAMQDARVDAVDVPDSSRTDRLHSTFYVVVEALNVETIYKTGLLVCKPVSVGAGTFCLKKC